MIGEINTARLWLRPITSADVDLLVELNSDREVMQFISGQPSAREEVEIELEDSLGARWLVFDDAGTFLGWVGAVRVADGSEYDIGWRFRRACWGKGFATEAALALVAALFSTGVKRVFAQTMAVNERSRSVMERLGLQYARTFHLEFDDPLPGTELGEVEYELTRETWEGRA
ncbi:MAG: GNAT family N-acetyltransferase [Acidimicrobiales bacterium]